MGSAGGLGLTDDERRALHVAGHFSGCEHVPAEVERILADRVEAARREAVEEFRTEAAKELEAMTRHYPEDVFPGPQPADDKYAVMHGASDMARHIYGRVAPALVRGLGDEGAGT